MLRWPYRQRGSNQGPALSGSPDFVAPDFAATFKDQPFSRYRPNPAAEHSLPAVGWSDYRDKTNYALGKLR